MTQWTRENRLAAIIAERGLSTRGFRRSLRKLVEEFTPYTSEEEDGCTREEAFKYEFQEWFGDCSVLPTAYRIRRDGNREGIFGVTVEVYEVEGTAELSEWKFALYGCIADGDGPHCELHILDKYDHEIIIQSDDLMGFAFIGMEKKEDKREMLKWARSQATAQHHAPVIVDDHRLAEREVEIRALKRQLMKTEHSQIAGSLQEVIYGLGLGRSYDDIARRANIQPVVVRATARLLKANAVNPKEIVNDTHARWKAAYDAVRELGIQL